MHNTEIVYAIHDFVAENEDEIAFNAGESIIVLEKDEKYMDGWWQVSSLQEVSYPKKPFIDSCLYRVVIPKAKLDYFL